MPVEVILPKVDMDMATGRISRWFVAEGAAVKKGELLFEIETDKAAMEIDAPASGTLRNVVARENVDIPVGQAVAWIYAEGEAESVISPLEGEMPGRAEAGAVPPTSQPSGSRNPAASSSTLPPSVLPDISPSRGEIMPSGAVRATPLARRIARETGVELTDVEGSGPRGRVTRKDVEARATRMISPLEGEMSGRTEGGTVPQMSQPLANAGSATSSSTLPPSGLPPLAPSRGEITLNSAWLRTGGAGAALVLLHGFGADLNSWRPMLAAANIGSPVLGIDLPGHGASPRDLPDGLDAIAEAVEAAIAAHHAGPVVLAGHSFGGAVAATIASRAQADIRALLLIAPAGLGPEINGAFLDGFGRAQSEASLLPWLRQLVTEESVLSRPFINATVAQAADAGMRQAQGDIARRFFADGTQTFDIRATLAALDIPVRVIFGTADRIIPASHAHGLPGAIGIHLFAATGHMPQLERRAEVMRILAEMARAAR